MMKRQKAQVLKSLGLFLFALLLLLRSPDAYAQSIVVMVNGDPVTSFDITQRQRFLALTSGIIGKKLKAAIKSKKTQQDFREYMAEVQPMSQEEIKQAQKQFGAKLQRQVMGRATAQMRRKALDQLIEEKLMLQAAKKLKIVVTDKDVNARLSAMAKAGKAKLTVKQFMGQFSRHGVNPRTVRHKIKAKIAWAQVVRKVYGSRVQQAVSTTTSTTQGKGTETVDMLVLRFALTSNSQKAIAQRRQDALNVRKRFSSCKTLPALLKGVKGVSMKTVRKAKLTSFQGVQHAAIKNAQAGQMTPPSIRGRFLESYAICAKDKAVATGKTKKLTNTQQKLQKEFSLYSRRHLKDLKDRARLDYLGKK
jgi:peptidyl-prolyl cis-trans isomerase SurA